MRIHIRTIDYPITKYERVLQKYGLVTKYKAINDGIYEDSHIKVDTLEDLFKISNEIKKNLIIWEDNSNREEYYNATIYDGYLE